MATSVQVRNPGWCDGLTLAAQDIRLVDISALLSGLGGPSGSQLGVGSGVRDATNNPLQVSVATGLSVTVNPGFALIQGSTAANAGTYSTCVDTAATLTCQTADLVNPRIDVVCVSVVDNGNATSNAVVQVITGTAAPSPTAPALPSNSVALCQVRVAANATSLTSGNLTDVRTFAAAAGGIVTVLNSSLYPTVGNAAGYLHNASTGRMVRSNGGGGVVTPSTAGFAPLQASAVGSPTATSTTPVTIVSASVTTDAVTPVEVYLTFQAITTSSTSQGTACVILCFRDSTQLGSVIKGCAFASQVIDGATLTFPDVPGAGTHTYTFKIATQGSGHFAIQDAAMSLKAISP